MANKHESKDKRPPEAPETPKAPPVISAAEVKVQTLEAHQAALGPADPAVRAELFDGIGEEDFVTDGLRAVSQDLVDGVRDYVSSIRSVLGQLGASQQDTLVGFDVTFLAVLVDEARKLQGLVTRANAEGIAVEVSLAERQSAAESSSTAGIALRDQAARAMRRVLRGQGAELAALERSVGNAKSASALDHGLSFLASQIEQHLAGDNPARASLMNRAKLTADYARRLRAAGQRAALADSLVNAPAQVGVTQRTLDLQDGRVMRLVDWINRAFRDANAVDRSVPVPKLGSLAALFVNARRTPKEPVTPDPVKPL